MNMVSAEDPASMPTVADYLGADRGTPAAVLFERSTTDLGNGTVPKEWFTSRAVHDREVERMWKKVWQMACRENDIPEVGNQIVYDIADQSVVIVRAAPDVIRAYHNVCQHRGNRLVDGCSTSDVLECSFHGWRWNLDGSLNRVPCRWDFPEVDDARYRLTDCAAATWNGFVFVNLDPAAAPLSEFLGETIPRHFEAWPRERAWKALHLGKVVPCNWKAAQQAFLEVYHTIRTHPVVLQSAGDANAQYDSWGPHMRMVSCMGVASPHLGDTVDDQTVVDTFIRDVVAGSENPVAIPEVAPGQTSRQVISDFLRGLLLAQTGVDYSAVSDAEVLDVIQYFVFPNFFPWGGYSFPLVYRFRPNGNDPDSCIFDVMLLARLPDGAPLPPDTPLQMTPADAPWADVKELMALGPILDEDMVNLKKIQRGLHSDGLREITFSNYQERNLRNFFGHLERVLEE